MAVTSMLAKGWCAVDHCPSTICNGPHVTHICSISGDHYTVRFDVDAACPECGTPMNKHPFTTEGYVHAHMLGVVDCAVCGEKIGAVAHAEKEGE